MKILFATPGHLKTVPMGKFCADALKELGHEILVFDYRATVADKLIGGVAGSLSSGHEEKRGTNMRLRRAIDRFEPDLFLTLFGFDISIDSLDYLREQGVPSACWWINDPFQLPRSLKKAAHYDYMFSNSAGCLDQYLEAGARHAFFLPTACDPGTHRPVAARPEYECEVCFAGDWSPLRERIVEKLVDHFDVRIFGPWGKKIAPESRLHQRLKDGFFTPDQMASMFCSAKVVLNIHTWYGNFDHGLNPRLFEAAGCGAFQAVDWKQEIPSLFDCETEVRCYRDEDELLGIIQQAISDDVFRKNVAHAAHLRAHRDHTYRNRMESLLKHIAETQPPGSISKDGITRV